MREQIENAKRYAVRLKSVMRKKQTTKTVRNRCQIIIDLDEAHGKVLTHAQSAKTNCVCMATIMNTVKLYSEKGIQGIRTMNRNEMCIRDRYSVAKWEVDKSHIVKQPDMILVGFPVEGMMEKDVYKRQIHNWGKKSVERGN